MLFVAEVAAANGHVVRVLDGAGLPWQTLWQGHPIKRASVPCNELFGEVKIAWHKLTAAELLPIVATERVRTTRV